MRHAGGEKGTRASRQGPHAHPDSQRFNTSSSWMVAVKLELWDKLATEEAPADSLRYAKGLWHYAQGMRHVRNSDAKSARAELGLLAAIERDTTLVDVKLWGINAALDVLAVAHKVLEGEVLAAEGDMSQALERLQEAVAAEDALQYQEPPDWSFPSRHELGPCN
ncbi:MAG: hypothetical protein IPG74_00430 [Flavobacteriales bacterium]|nr:hypothetical protein [Flavobacteriales bacterium]